MLRFRAKTPSEARREMELVGMNYMRATPRDVKKMRHSLLSAKGNIIKKSKRATTRREQRTFKEIAREYDRGARRLRVFKGYSI